MPKIIRTMQMLGYSPCEIGVCFGIAMMGSQAIIRNDSQAFVDRIKFIQNASEEQIESIAEPFDRKVKKDLHEKKIDLWCFFDELSIYQGKKSVNQEFKSIAVNTQCADNVKNLDLDLTKKNNQFYPVVKEKIINLFTCSEFFKFIIKVRNCMDGRSFSIVLSHSPKNHATQIGFDAKQKQWFSSDHDYVVAGENNFKDLKKVLRNIFSSHQCNYGGVCKLAVSLDILISEESGTEIDLSILKTYNFNQEQINASFNKDALSHLIASYESASCYDELIDVFEKIKSLNLPESENIQLLESKRNNGFTLLRLLAEKGEADVVKKILEKTEAMNLNIMSLFDKKDDDIPPLLISAVQYRCEKVVKVFADTIKTIENENSRAKLLGAKRNDGASSLLISVINGDKDIAQALISAISTIKNDELKAEILGAKGSNGMSALFVATTNGCLKIADTLTRAISSIKDWQLRAKLLEAKRNDNTSALSIAIYNGYNEIAQVLVSEICGIQNHQSRAELLEAKRNDGVSALLLATENGQEKVVAALILAMCNIKDHQLRAKLLEAKDSDGTSALLVAAANDSKEIVKMLIDAICSIKDSALKIKLLEAKNDDGESASSIAIKNEHNEIAQTLASVISSIENS